MLSRKIRNSFESKPVNDVWESMHAYTYIHIATCFEKKRWKRMHQSINGDHG